MSKLKQALARVIAKSAVTNVVARFIGLKGGEQVTFW